MIERNPRTFSVVTADEIGADNRQWIEVMPTGEKLRNGRWFFTITDRDLEAYAESIRQAGEKRLPIDYDHSGAEGGPTRASGWFTGDAEVRETPDGPRLYAQVEWTPGAAESIQNGEYRFISPEFSFQNRDAKTGLMTKAKQLLAATLTNRPFFQQLAPVGDEEPYLLTDQEFEALNTEYGEDTAKWIRSAALIGDEEARKIIAHLPQAQETEEMKIEAIAEALGLPEDAEESAVLEAIQKLKTPPAPEPAVVTTTNEEGDDMSPEVKKALGLPEDADDKAVITAIGELKTAAKIDPEALHRFESLATAKVASDARLAQLEREAQQRLHENERDTLLAKAVEEGRILPVHKESLSALYDINPDSVRTMIEDSPKRSFRERGSGEAGPGERPQPRRIETPAGGVVEIEDDEWLDHRAHEILRAAGKTKFTDDEYFDALASAQAEVR